MKNPLSTYNLRRIVESVDIQYREDFERFKVVFNDPNITHVSFSPQLGYVLGLTENMIIGNSLSSLLRVVSVSGATPGEYNEKIYDSPIFARVLPREIGEIEIELRTMDNVVWGMTNMYNSVVEHWSQVRQVIVFWECEIGEMKRHDPNMQRAFNKYLDKGPINLKDCYHGGRVGPHLLHYQVPDGWRMKYYDVRSLYPYTNATTPYPTGHPARVNIIQGPDSVVDWRHPDDIPVRGILKVFVVPPLRIDVPVLPVKFDQRLLFPLCRSCALRHPQGSAQSGYSCTHNADEERGWVSTVTSIELAEALRNGYRCVAYYRSIEWEDLQWDDRVFRGYVAEFMAMKTHASGFPEDVQTADEQQQFINECEEMFGIIIDQEKMSHNKAKRTIAKLCNNSLWGRFSLRNGLSKTIVTDSPAELRALLDNPSIEVSAVDQLSEECVLLTYAAVNEWVEEHDCSNIVLSLWTTSAARLHLLRLMQKVVRAPNSVLIYTDTDSVCFAYREADGCPLKTGPHLGDLSDEWPEHELLEFVSGGCKQYALRMRQLQTGEQKTILKVRGITLTADACRLLHFDTFKQSVLRYARGQRRT
uniref:DNA-directed DNA polymerase n=1 Tax=Globodera pallida TaxID=36090 RepID=A0A183C8S4_GLOPA